MTLVRSSRTASPARCANRLNFIIAFLKAFEFENLIDDKGERRIEGIDAQRLSAQILIRGDPRPHDYLVEAMVEADDNRNIDAGHVGHRDGVVDG
jgi:hypothetical protein